jgi:hypothetical protein
LASAVDFAIFEFLGCFCFVVCLAVDFPFEIRRRQNKKEEAFTLLSEASQWPNQTQEMLDLDSKNLI